jgi:hypothetical protein
MINLKSSRVCTLKVAIYRVCGSAAALFRPLTDVRLGLTGIPCGVIYPESGMKINDMFPEL